MPEMNWGRKETIIWPPHQPIYTYGAIFIALVAAGFFVYLRFAIALNPLERYYLPTYIKTSIALSVRSSGKYQVLLVSDASGKAWYALNGNVQSGSTPQANDKPIPLALSDTARQRSMVSLYRGAPTVYQNKPLHAWLQKQIYSGETVASIFEQPLVFGLVALLLQLPFSITKDIRRRKQMKYGRRLKGPILVTPKQFNKAIGGTGIGLKVDQCDKMLRIPLLAEDQHFEIIGDTGSGKTTIIMQMLRQIQARGHSAILYDPGYAVEGFAPTSRAARQLNEAGVEARTLQGFLAHSVKPDAAEQKHFYLVDESSLASTNQMREFLARLGPNDRVLLIGDTRQHQGVEAGRPFEQLQEAGMRTAKLDEIVRQKDPALKSAVEMLAKGQVSAALESLQQQGRVQEIPNAEERIRAIAKAYVESPEKTLIVSPDNASRRELNVAVRQELKANGTLAPEDRTFRVLVQRQDMTGAERTWASHYEINDVVRYSRGSQAIGMEAGSYGTVAAINPAANLLTVEKSSGGEVSYDPRRLTGVSVYREIDREFSVGDRIQFTAPDKTLGVANRDLASVESISPDGRISARLDNDHQIEFDATEHRHFDHGYAVTSHSSQGLTAERVLVNADTGVHPDLLNSRFGYVSISRASHEATLFTNDLAKLSPQLSADVSKTSALEINQSPSISQGIGMGI
jgi:RecA/RadA recombinase